MKARAVKFLSPGALVLTSFVAVGIGCGGKAVVDGGQGGSGGTAQSNTTQQTNVSVTNVTQSSSTGQMTGCDCYCDLAVACGVHGAAECPAICAGLDKEFTDCACQNGICDFGACTPGPVAVSSSTGPGGNGGGMPWSQQCFSCIDASQSNPACQSLQAQCVNDPSCVEKLECHSNCGWTFACNDACDAQFGVGQTFLEFIDCAICDSCTGACSETSAVQDYCESAPPPPPQP